MSLSCLVALRYFSLALPQGWQGVEPKGLLATSGHAEQLRLVVRAPDKLSTGRHAVSPNPAGNTDDRQLGEAPRRLKVW